MGSVSFGLRSTNTGMTIKLKLDYTFLGNCQLITNTNNTIRIMRTKSAREGLCYRWRCRCGRAVGWGTAVRWLSADNSACGDHSLLSSHTSAPLPPVITFVTLNNALLYTLLYISQLYLHDNPTFVQLALIGSYGKLETPVTNSCCGS